MRRACLVCVFLLAARPAPAAESWPVPRGPSREPAPYRYDPKALVKVPRAFLDDSVATILYAGSSYLVEADGTIETVTHEVTRLNGRKGVEKLGEYRGITWTPSHQKVTLNLALIHKASGATVAVQPRHAHLRDVSTDFQVYDPEKQLIISFPGLEVGDTIEVKWTVRGKNPEHGGQFFTRYSFGDPQHPVVLDEFRVRVPRDRALKYASVNGKVEPEISESGDARLYRWKTANRPRPPRDENLPSKEELRPTVLVSTFTSWDEVGRWKQKLRESCWKCTPAVRAVVERVTKGLATPAEKARALTYWVRRHVRYVSAGDKHDYTPHPPEQVLANRFGDCKDTSQLLAVLLREAGVRVELATLGAQDDGQVHPDVPSPWGTHAILLATIAGKEHWIDTTASLAGWDFLPRDDLDRLCYLTDETGKLRLKRTPPPAAERNRVEQTTDVWLGPDGTSRCRRTVTSSGAAAVSARDRYVEVPPGERRRQLTAQLQDANSRTRLLRLSVDEKKLMDYDQPVVVRTEFEIPRHFTGTTEREGSVTDSRVWNRLLAYNIDHDRTSPLVLPSPFESRHTYRFHAPAVLLFDGPPRDKTVRSKWGTFSVQSQAADDADGIRHLEVVFHTRLEKTRVEVEDLEAFRKFHEEVNREYRVWLTLRPVSELASAPLLERLLLVAPQDAYAAARLARIYLKADRLPDARRVLARSCYYAPDAAELWDLRVQAAGSPEEEEKARRELLKKYPKRPSAILGLAGVLISRGKQAEARALLEPLTKSERASTRAQAHYQLARSHYRQDELKEALAQLTLAARADATAIDTVRAHVLRGQVLDELKRPADAVAAYEKALEVDRGNQEVLLSLVRLCLLNKDEQAAVGYLRRYVQRAGKDVSGLLLAAETYYRLGRLDDALELALRARELTFHEKAQRIMGLVYLARGDFARAKRHLEKAEPDAAVLAGLLRATVHLGEARGLEALLARAERLDRHSVALGQQMEQARKALRRRSALEKLVKLPAGKEEEGARALDALACAELLAGEAGAKARAEALLAKAFEAKLAIGPAHALRARLLLQAGKLRRAREEATLAVKLCPEDPAGHYVQGRIRLEAGQEALEDLERAARLSGNRDADVLSALADAQAAAGKLDQAVGTARAALKLRPADRELARQLRALEESARKKRAG